MCGTPIWMLYIRRLLFLDKLQSWLTPVYHPPTQRLFRLCRRSKPAKTLTYAFARAKGYISVSYPYYQRCLCDADELKEEGNEEFRRNNWEEALISYQSALRRLPPRKQKRKRVAEADPDPSDDEESPSGSGVQRQAEHRKEEETVQAEEPEDARIVKARAILNSNIGACYVKLVREAYPFFLIYYDCSVGQS
jgi:hypothetical protein